jgi:putative membrane protein
LRHIRQRPRRLGDRGGEETWESRIVINAEERERLAQAIRDAEARTAGEIVLVVAAQASDYRSVPILWALLLALVTPWPLIWLTGLSPTRIFQLQLVVALVASFVLSLPERRHRLVPARIKRARAHEAAAREFISRGLTRTRGRTGVLIYVAVAEHHAEIVADTGISERVDPEVWRHLIEELIEQIRNGRAAKGLLAAVKSVGRILAEHAPPHADDENELPNKVIVT